MIQSAAGLSPGSALLLGSQLVSHLGPLCSWALTWSLTWSLTWAPLCSWALSCQRVGKSRAEVGFRREEVGFRQEEVLIKGWVWAGGGVNLVVMQGALWC